MAALNHPKGKRVLIVDDEEDMRNIITDSLGLRGYAMFSAGNATEGFALLKENISPPVDLIISDINMPDMKGFEFLREVEKLYPLIKRVLITAYDVDDYLGKCIEYGISNIISKSAPFNFAELESVVYSLITEDIFGLPRHMQDGARFSPVAVRSDNDIENVSAQVSALLPAGKSREHLKLAMVEMLYNAVVYGVMQYSSEEKIEVIGKINLPPDQAVLVTFGSDAEKVGVSVEDNGGRLKKEEVLYWLERQTKVDDQGIPKGLYDFHGRGFFLVRKYLDRLIINIKKNVRTELILLKHRETNMSALNRIKPIYINEI
jgi:CheY-like chemotaxis protein/anti-sigma regulatory factor (Ser/Thr protein kinase)